MSTEEQPAPSFQASLCNGEGGARCKGPRSDENGASSQQRKTGPTAVLQRA